MMHGKTQARINLRRWFLQVENIVWYKAGNKDLQEKVTETKEEKSKTWVLHVVV